MDLALLILFTNLLMLLVFVVIKQINNRLLLSLLLLPVARLYIKVYKQNVSNRKITYLLFFLSAILSLAVASLYFDLGAIRERVYTLYQTTGLPYKDLYIWLSACLLFLIIKPLIEYATCYIIDIHKYVKSYIIYKFNLTNYCLILLGPLMLVNEFNNLNIYLNKTLIVFILGILYLFGILGFMFKYTKVILNHLHYFILYLCTFEFGMYLIIYFLVYD